MVISILKALWRGVEWFCTYFFLIGVVVWAVYFTSIYIIDKTKIYKAYRNRRYKRKRKNK